VKSVLPENNKSYLGYREASFNELFCLDMDKMKGFWRKIQECKEQG